MIHCTFVARDDKIHEQYIEKTKQYLEEHQQAGAHVWIRRRRPMALKEVDALFAMHGDSNGHCWVSDTKVTRKRKCDTFHMCMRRVRMCAVLEM